MKKISLTMSVLITFPWVSAYGSQNSCPVLRASHFQALLNSQDIRMKDQSKWTLVGYGIKNAPRDIEEYRKGWFDFIKVVKPVTAYSVNSACEYKNVGVAAYSRHTKDQISRDKKLQGTYNIGTMVVGSPQYNQFHKFYKIETLTIKVAPSPTSAGGS